MSSGIISINKGNMLVIRCQGENHCDGNIRIFFSPPIPGSPEPVVPESIGIWQRVSGEDITNITLSPSINAGNCGHFYVENGNITKTP